MVQSADSSAQRGLRLSVVMCGLVGLMILASIAQREWGTGSSAPKAGKARGDIRLAEDALPAEVSGWKVTGFQEPADGDTAEGIGWAHSWRIQKNQRDVEVSFDQVGFMGWHELTQCYQADGCDLAQREVKPGPPIQDASSWGYVQAVLTKSSGEQMILMYSIFNGNGESVEPPSESPSGEDAGFLARFNRTDGVKLGFDSESGRCLQVQLLVPDSSQLSDSDLAELEQLHFQTREMFRQHWIAIKATASSHP